MNEEEQMSGAYYSDQRDTSQIMDKADPSKIMNRIVHSLRAEILNIETGAWESGTRKAYVNENGISNIIAQLESLLNYNTTLSNLDDEEVSRIILGYGKANLRKAIYLNHKRWGIKLEDATTIMFIILYPVYFALKRGYMEGDKKFLTSTTQNVIQQSTSTIHDNSKKGAIRRRLGL